VDLRSSNNLNFEALRIGLFILLVLFNQNLPAQHKRSPADSVIYYLQTKPKFKLGLDGKQSVIGGQVAPVIGLRFGFDYSKIGFYTGIYYNGLNIFSGKDLYATKYLYQSSTFEYLLRKTWRWQVVTNWQIGLGIENKEVNGYVTSSKPFIPMEVGISATLRFLRYFGLGFGTGIRWSMQNAQGFAAPYYSGGLSFYSGTLLKDGKKLYHKIKNQH
jgi:hypothetical protein